MVPTTTAESVNRINLGVLFESKDTVDIIYDHWPHTFQLPFPQLDLNHSEVENIQCNKSSDFAYQCNALHSALHTLNTIKHHYLISQERTLTIAREAMPSVSDAIPWARSKRALLPFIGSLAHSLFGTATDKEVKRLKSHILSLEGRQKTMAEQFQRYSDDLSSFMSVSNSRFSAITTGVTDNHRSLLKMAKLFSTVAHTVEDNLRFTVHLAKDAYLAMSLQESLQEFLQGIHALIDNKISPYLLPISHIRATIHHINNELKDTHSGLFAKPLSADDMYSSPKFHWTYKNSSIFITYYFPLTSLVSKLTVYKIHGVPIPVGDNTSHVTSLANLPNYLAFSSDQHFYAYFEKDPNSKGNKLVDASKTSVPLFPMTHPSCATAVYFNNKQGVKDLCNYRVFLNAVEPTIKYIDEGKFMVMNTSELFLNWPNGRSRMEGCKFCILDVPCLCDVTTSNAYFPPRLNDCYEQEKPSIAHPINLAVLMHFHELDMLHEISASTTFNTPPKIPSPDIRLFSHNFSQLIADDSQKELSLEILAQSVKNGKYVFQSLSEPILDQLIDKEEDWDLLSWNSILTLVDSAALVLISLAFLYLLYRVNKLQAIYLQVNKAKAYQLFTTTQAQINTLTLHIVTEIDNRILYVLLTLASITLVCIAFKYLVRRIRHASIASLMVITVL